jgi:hypothetical protein
VFGSVGNDRNETNGVVHVFAGLFSFLVLDACFYGHQCGSKLHSIDGSTLAFDTGDTQWGHSTNN